MNNDKTIMCGCGTPFTFTEGEQRWYENKGFSPPKRCKECRIKKKEQRSGIMRHEPQEG